MTLGRCAGGSRSFWSGPGARKIRFHDLRHTFCHPIPGDGMDVKPLSAMLGHVSAATTLDIYTHVTGDMQSEAAAKIDWGWATRWEDTAQSEQSHMTDFQPVRRKIRQAGTGCISEINDHLFEGRYSPSGRTAHAIKKIPLQTPRTGNSNQPLEGSRGTGAGGPAGPDQVPATPTQSTTPKHKKIWMVHEVPPGCDQLPGPSPEAQG